MDLFYSIVARIVVSYCDYTFVLIFPESHDAILFSRFIILEYYYNRFIIKSTIYFYDITTHVQSRKLFFMILTNFGNECFRISSKFWRNTSVELALCRFCFSKDCVTRVSLNFVYNELSDGVRYIGVYAFMNSGIFTVLSECYRG